jgi:hypothetical protein
VSPAKAPPKGTDDPRFAAAVDLLARTGADEFRIRYCDEDEPIIWIAQARWRGHWEIAAAKHPVRAVFALCDQVIDGGKCTHCHRPTGFAEDLDPMPLPAAVCWYQWDPELATFRRGCAGVRP